MKLSVLLISLFILITLAPKAIAQGKDTVFIVESNNVTNIKNSIGTEFWLCFQTNFIEHAKKTPQTELLLQLFIASEYNSNVKISIEGIGYIRQLRVPAGSIVEVKIDPAAQIIVNDSAQKLAIHLTADRPVSVYGLNRRWQTTDTYLGLPSEVLGTTYRPMCYKESDNLMSQFAIVATENGTVVDINPSTNTTTHPQGYKFRIYLNKGEVYQVRAAKIPGTDSDLTGSLIESNKKIAVFSGHQCAYVPKSVVACNHLVEQMPPVPSWGRHFFLGKMQKRTKYSYRVLANENDTRVFLDEKLLTTLKAGQYYESQLDRNAQVTADKPILVAQYSQGYKNGDSIGDPMMLLVSPTQQFLNSYTIATPVNGNWDHYVNVVVPKSALSSFRLDGKKVNTEVFEPIGISSYAIAYLKIPYGMKKLTCSVPFGLYSYGFGYKGDAFDAYGNMGGQSFSSYNQEKDTLPPMIEYSTKGSQLNLIFRDDRRDDRGMANVKILASENLDISVPGIEPGTPQTAVSISPQSNITPGTAQLEATDVAMNSSYFTICYAYDQEIGTYRFSVSDNLLDKCESDKGWTFGAFAKLNTNFHSANFSNSAGLESFSKFSSASAFAGYGGFLVSRKFMSNLYLVGKLSLEEYSGVLSAAGRIDSTRDINTNKLVPYQEQREIELTGLFTHISLGGEYFFFSSLYASAGLNIAINLSKSIMAQDRILLPQNMTFSDGTRLRNSPDAPNTLESINLLRLGGYLGLGFRVPVDRNISIFSEGVFTTHFGSLIDDGDWGLDQFSLLIGLRYRI